MEHRSIEEENYNFIFSGDYISDGKRNGMASIDFHRNKNQIDDAVNCVGATRNTQCNFRNENALFSPVRTLFDGIQID